MKALVGLLCGIVFGVGLAMSGMTDTAKVLGFLDVTGQWIPDLAFVMGGAVLVTLIAFRFVPKMKRPALNPRFYLPATTVIDGRLLGGARCHRGQVLRHRSRTAADDGAACTAQHFLVDGGRY